MGGRMATVLLAEDDADIRYLVTFKLEQVGHEVRAFGDGLSALTDARGHPPELAVLDVMMPGMSGLDVCRELRKDPATADVPIIRQSAGVRSVVAAISALGRDQPPARRAAAAGEPLTGSRPT